MKSLTLEILLDFLSEQKNRSPRRTGVIDDGLVLSRISTLTISQRNDAGDISIRVMEQHFETLYKKKKIPSECANVEMAISKMLQNT